MKIPAPVDEKCVGLPGEGLVRKGLEDFSAGRETIESLLIQIGAPRLRWLGIPIPQNTNPDADYWLYHLLGEQHGAEAHAQYNSWLRELISFERALGRKISADKV